MLIALIGPPGAGKASVAHYLATQHGFRRLALGRAPTSSSSSSFSGGNDEAMMLPSSKVMLDYVTDRWDQPFVTLDLNTVVDLEAFIKRPFFLCVEVGAAVLLRWKRFNAKHRGEKGRGGGGEVGLEEFVGLDDEVSYGHSGGSASSMMNGVEGIEGGKDGEAMTSTLSSSSLIGGNGIVDNMASIALSNPSTSSASTPAPSLSTHNGLSGLRRYIHLSILNNFPTLAALHAHLTQLNLPSDQRLRPCWDSYFLRLCNLASLRSNCMKRRVGAVLVSSNRILSTGYNGTPSGLKNCNQGGCARCNNTLSLPSLSSSTPPIKPDLKREGSSACGQNLSECLCLHAEENALLEAGRAKISGGDATMYCNTCPCLRCAVKIVQTGIKKVVYQLEYSMDERTKAIFKESGVAIRQVHLDA